MVKNKRKEQHPIFDQVRENDATNVLMALIKCLSSPKPYRFCLACYMYAFKGEIFRTIRDDITMVPHKKKPPNHEEKNRMIELAEHIVKNKRLPAEPYTRRDCGQDS